MRIKNTIRAAVLAGLGIAILSGCSSYTTYPARVYQLDSNCTYYYINGAGNAVYDGQYSMKTFCGKPMMQDSSGRYYQDSWGNRVYVSKHCNHMMKKWCGKGWR